MSDAVTADINRLEVEREALVGQRDELEQRIEALDIALKVLRGGGGTEELINAMFRASRGTTTRQRGAGVGDDKLDAVRTYIRRVKRARQADVVRELGFNSGTVSTAFSELEKLGEVEAGPKQDRSRVWVAR